MELSTTLFSLKKEKTNPCKVEYEIKGIERHHIVGLLNWMMDENLIGFKDGVFFKNQ